MAKTSDKQLQYVKTYIEKHGLVQLHLRMRKDQSDYLKELAKKEGTSVTRMILDHFHVPS